MVAVMDLHTRKIVGEAAQGSDRVAGRIAAEVGPYATICGPNWQRRR